MRAVTPVFIAALLTASSSAQPARDKSLAIYVVDVEGGNATLFVGPSGGSVLIDTGNGGAAAVRDADRIMAAVKDAGLAQIDHLITTHWHGDHFGAMAELARRISIRHFVDHGPNVQPAAAADEFLEKVYPTLYAAAKHTVAKPGDTLPVPGLDWRIVTAAGRALASPLQGAGRANPYCADFKPQDEDRTENAQSVGSVITFGRFRVAHLGDLTWNKEFDLMCPANRIGTVDLFVVSHHAQPVSNSPQLVHALEARAAIINNGTRKGGQPDAMRIIHSAPRLEDVWQMHFSLLSGQEFTVPGLFIANLTDDNPDVMPLRAMPPPAPGSGAPPPPVHNGPAYWIKVSANTDGSFTITNGRNGFTKRYGIERAARIEDATLAEVNEVTPEMSTAEVRDVLANRSATILAADQTAVVVDTREARDFQRGSLRRARNIPRSLVLEGKDVGEVKRAKDDGRLPMADHNTRIIVVGGSAADSSYVADALAREAFHNVTYYAGPIDRLLTVRSQ